MNFDLAKQLNEFLAQNDIDRAIGLTEKKLLELPKTDFHKIIGKNLKHLTSDLASYIDEFCKTVKEKIDVKAIYSEMNGFTINCDLWYIDLFAFTKCGALDDLDWLADFEVSSENSMAISGFEDLQTVYEDYMEKEKWKDDRLAEASGVCELLIILRLQELFRESKQLAIDKKFESADIPLFVTAHDYDLIYKTKVTRAYKKE